MLVVAAVAAAAIVVSIAAAAIVVAACCCCCCCCCYRCYCRCFGVFQLSKEIEKEYLRNEICVTELKCDIVELKMKHFNEKNGIEN